MNARLLNTLQQYSPKLQFVYCGESPDLTDDVIISFCTSFPSLKRLVLFCACKLTDAAVEAIVEHCPDLQKLPLAGWDLLTDKALLALAQLTGLKSLHLTGNLSYTNSSIANIVRNNPGMRSISLTLRANARYDVRVLRYVAGYCDNLKYLDIQASPRL